MTVELPAELELAIEQYAALRGLSPSAYVRTLVEREVQPPSPTEPLISMRGFWEGQGISLSEEDIDENRRDMLKGSIFDPDVL